MSLRKEPHFFSKEKAYSNGSTYLNSVFFKQEHVKYYGESSTGYFISETAINRIRQDIINPRIIIILREPLERVISHYRYRVRLGVEKRPFLKAIEESGYGYNENKTIGFGYDSYIQFSKYSIYCPLWINTFKPENVTIITREFFSNEFGSCMDRIVSFLGIDPSTHFIPERKNALSENVRRPSRWMTRGASMVPKCVKSTSAFKCLKQKILKLRTNTNEIQISKRDIQGISKYLEEDVRYYDKINNDLHVSVE